MAPKLLELSPKLHSNIRMNVHGRPCGGTDMIPLASFRYEGIEYFVFLHWSLFGLTTIHQALIYEKDDHAQESSQDLDGQSDDDIKHGDQHQGRHSSNWSKQTTRLEDDLSRRKKTTGLEDDLSSRHPSGTADTQMEHQHNNQDRHQLRSGVCNFY